MNEEQAWTAEAHGLDGQNILHLKDLSADEVVKVVRGALNDSKTGGVVIYRSPNLATNKKGGDLDADQGLGVVTDEPVAGGNGSLSYCRYCQTTGGHTADCPVIS